MKEVIHYESKHVFTALSKAERRGMDMGMVKIGNELVSLILDLE